VKLRIQAKTLILPIIVTALTLGFLWFTSEADTEREPTWEDVVAQAARGGYKLINTEELEGLYRKDPGEMLLVDTRQEWEFAMGHIKGAINFPMDPTWRARWLKKSDLEKALGADKDRPIVFY